MAKKLLAAVKLIDATAVTPAKRSALSQRLKTQMRQLQGAERQAAARKLLDVAVLEHFLNRWFLKERKEVRGEGERNTSHREKIEEC
jgi:hypothetical protein